MNRTKLTQRILPIVAYCCASLLVIASVPAHAATIGWNQEAGGTYDYNDTNNWVNGSINGIWDDSLTLLGSQTATFGVDTVLDSGIDLNYVGGFNVAFTGTGGTRNLTLGGDININTASDTRTINFGSTSASLGLNVDLGGVTRNFTVGSGRSLGFVNVVSNGGINFSGGSLNFSGANTYAGATNITSGAVNLNGSSGSAANSNFTLTRGTGSTPTLTFNGTTGGTTGTTRAGSVTLEGSGSSTGVLLNVSGNASANNVESIANALTAGNGFSTVTISPNGARNTRLTAGSFARNAGATMLIRGADLGVSTIASLTAGDANLQFGTTPTLVGGGGGTGTTTIGLIKGVYGDVTTSSSGSTGGLLTYDSTYGVRLLNPSTEYQAAISNGQTQLDNVLFARTSGSASQDFNLTSPMTTINSLSFKITGAGTNSGVTLSGDAGTTLRLNSGMIFASQTVSAVTASDAMTISVPTLDLNGQEGVFLAFTNGVNQGNTNGSLNISSVIANDGGQGVTIGGTGQVRFTGSQANTYTGPTTLNSGILRLEKSVANIGLTTDLIMHGGTLLKNSNAIADTASVTINGGLFVMDTTTSSGNNGHQETVNNFTMNGGGLSTNSGSNASLTMLGNLTLSASQLRLNAGGDVTVFGNTNLTGGTLHARESSSSSTVNGFTSLVNVNITNTASDPYTAIILNGSNTNLGGRLSLNGNVTFTGNSTNSNTVLIDTNDSALTNQSVLALEGTRTFNIGNGAAAIDLTINPALVNGATTGGLIKSGTGTLALNGMNSYTGATTVNNGTLFVNGALSGATGVSVASGGRIGGSGAIFTTIGGAGSIDPGVGPGILTTSQVNPTGGLDFNFEFNLVNSLPNFTTTQNDVLRLMDANPFTQALNNSNSISLYIDANSLQFGDVLFGGIYTDAGDMLPELSNANILAYLEDETGSIEYMGKNYSLFTQGLFTIGTVANSEFALGGYLTTFTFAPAPVPEPATSLLVLCGAVLVGQVRRRNRK